VGFVWGGLVGGVDGGWGLGSLERKKSWV